MTPDGQSETALGEFLNSWGGGTSFLLVAELMGGNLGQLVFPFTTSREQAEASSWEKLNYGGRF